MHTTKLSFQTHSSYKLLELTIHLRFSIFRDAAFNTRVRNLVGQANAGKRSEDGVVIKLYTKSLGRGVASWH